jgi:hypothetical protein
LDRSIINDPLHWRNRAEEARAMATEIRDPQARATMLRIAEGYDDMATRAEARGATVLPFPASLSRSS